MYTYAYKRIRYLPKLALSIFDNKQQAIFLELMFISDEPTTTINLNSNKLLQMTFFSYHILHSNLG